MATYFPTTSYYCDMVWCSFIFKQLLNYDDSYFICNDFVLWCNVIVIYSQKTLDYYDDYLFSNNLTIIYLKELLKNVSH